MSTRVCSICGDPAEEWIAKLELHVSGAGACLTCAEKVANAFCKLQTGRWLTWPNEQKRPVYTKAVIPHDLRRSIFERDKYRCVMCDTHFNLTLDHIVAEVKGGETVESNLRTLCRPCNSRKGDK